jgi:alanine racemase
MNRLGLKSDTWGEAVRLIRKSKRPLEGLFTHFATYGDSIFTRQVMLFEEAVRWFFGAGIIPRFIHSENSAALFAKNNIRKGILSEVANLVRPGLALYGYHNLGLRSPFKLEPVLELVSEIGLVKEVDRGEGVSYGHLYRAKKKHSIGVVPLGYADGLSKVYVKDLNPEWRSPSDRKKGVLNISGAICMDMVMVQSKSGHIAPHDRVVFWGRFKNSLLEKRIVEPYELNLRIAKRIPRIWVP